MAGRPKNEIPRVQYTMRIPQPLFERAQVAAGYAGIDAGQRMNVQSLTEKALEEKIAQIEAQHKYTV